MARERILNDMKDLEASAFFKARMVASGKTQAQIASEIGEGLSQGTVWQWANERLAIPAERALEAAKAVGAKPEEISVSWRRIAEHFNSGRAPGDYPRSQSQRLNVVKVMSTTKTLITFLRRRDPEAVLDLTDPDDAELFAAVYAEALALPPQPTEEENQIFGAVVSNLMAKRGAGNERSRSEQAAGDTGKEVRRRGSSKKA